MRKIHYAWVIMVIGVLLMICNNGFAINVLGSFLPFIEESGLSGTQGSSLVTIRSVAGFVGVLAVPFVFRRLSLRAGLSCLSLTVGAAYLIIARASSYGVFCLGTALLGLSYGLGSATAVTMLVKRWFRSRFSTAIGLCMAGSGVASVATAIWARDFVPEVEYDRTFQAFQRWYSAGGIAFTTLPGFLFDRFGTYTIFFIIHALMLLFVGVMVELCYRRVRRSSVPC